MKNKKLNILYTLLIIIIIFIILFLLIDNDQYIFEDIALKDIIIEPNSKYGIIEKNNISKLSLQVNKTSKKDYKQYINKIIEYGFNKNINEQETFFSAQDENYYDISIIYKNRKMFIELSSPLINLNGIDLALQIPTIDSSYGYKITDTKEELTFIICDIDQNEYKEYIEKSKSKGFDQNINQSENVFFANNKENYSLRITKLNKNVMKVTVLLPKYDISLKLNYYSSDDTNNPNIKIYIDDEHKDNIKLKESKQLDLTLGKGLHEIKFVNEKDDKIFYTEEISLPNTDEIKYNLRVVNSSIDNDTQMPKATSIKITSPQSGNYRYKQQIVLRVQFDENITGTAPTLKLSIGKTEVTCSVKELKDNYIDYTYTVGKTEFGVVEVAKISGTGLTDAAGNEVEIGNLKNSGYQINILEREKDKGGIYEKSYTTSKGSKINYYIYIPNIDLVDTYDNLPLIIQMQCCCIDTFAALKNYGLLGYLRNGKVKDVPAIVVTPKAYTSSPITEFDTKYTMEFINAIVKEYKINKKKITISGHSQGARHVLRLVKATPNYFAGTVLLSWLESGSYRHDMQTLPMPDCQTLFVFEEHKGGDYNCNIAKSLAKKYSNITVIRSKGTVHGDVYKAFYQDGLVDWMLSQTRK